MNHQVWRQAVAAVAAVTVFVGGLIAAQAAPKKLVLAAGKASHGPGDHEFRAGSLILQRCLQSVPDLQVTLVTNGWPADESVFAGADAVLFFADGGGGHPAIQGERMKLVDSWAAKGVGIGCAHYGVEVPKGDPGAAMHRWIGGYYEHQFSVNPMWKPDYSEFPKHAVTRGVKPFRLIDEWYFNMRWIPEQTGVTPILVAKPLDQVRDGPYVYPRGPYPHIQEAKGRSETMMWVYERPNGGRGFGFTGGHKHVNWANDSFRKIVLNALLWIAKIEVPAEGVVSTVDPVELSKNLDEKGVPADAPNLTGTWQIKAESDQGTWTRDIQLIQGGQNLIGTYKGSQGESELSGEFKAKSKEVQWSFETVYEGQKVLRTFEGTVIDKNTMKGKAKMADFEATWTATR